MATREALAIFAQTLARKNYYEILGIPAHADAGAVKSAFHHFSLLYHPDRYIDAPAEARAVALDIYKRGVEAYRCLSRAPLRARYDRGLPRGRIRLDPSHPSTAPPAPFGRTLEAIATTPRGRQFAVRADRLIAIGRLEEARVQLVTACQCEPANEELAERLQILHEALALQPL